MMRSIDTFVYEVPLPPGWVDETVRMRRKMETKRRFSGPAPIDVKIGEGGMADVEFLAQMIQLRYGREEQALRGPRRIEEILGEQSRSFFREGERTDLLDSYRHYRRIETVIRVTLAERSALLPEGEKLNMLARFLSFPDGDAFRTYVSAQMRRTRTHFLNIARRLAT
jgi:glutamate-ammonia-ligase adenylyltransferase